MHIPFPHSAAAVLLGIALSATAELAAAGDDRRDQPLASPLHFASPEHQYLGSQVQLDMPDGRRLPGDQAVLLRMRMSTGATHELSYAELGYLAGDFYGVPYAPVAAGAPFDLFAPRPGPAESAARAALLRNILAFAYRGYADFLPRIRELELGLSQRFADARAANRPMPYTIDDECAFMLATGAESCIRSASDLLNLRDYLGLYTELAARSDDHFHAGAQLSFLLGTKMALEQALRARGPEDLRFAYLLAAYASHFGGDAFAAGHVRTDKHALNAYCAPQLADYGFTGWSQLLLTGVLAKRMHDQDNARGIVITGRDGQRWTAYGDLSMGLRDDEANVRRAFGVQQLAVDRIHQAYVQRERIDAERYVAATLRELQQQLPDIEATTADTTDNGAPLFEPQGQRMLWNDPELGSRDLDCMQAVRRYIGDLGGEQGERLRSMLRESPGGDTARPPAQAQRSIDVSIELDGSGQQRGMVCEWGKLQHGDFPSTEGAFTNRSSAHLESNGAATGAEGDLYCLLPTPDLRDTECQFTVHFDNPFLGSDEQHITHHEGACTVDVDDNGRGNNWRPRVRVQTSARP